MGDHLFPLKIDIHHYTYRTDITLELESLSFDTISDDRFSIKPPQGASYFGIEKLGEPN
jgi:outer membrane lipoprotein-sorting protein